MRDSSARKMKEEYGYNPFASVAVAPTIILAIGGAIAICVGTSWGSVMQLTAETDASWLAWALLASGLVMFGCGMTLAASTTFQSAYVALRLRVPVRFSREVGELYEKGLRDLLRASPRAAIFAMGVADRDCIERTAAHDSRETRQTPRGETIYGAFYENALFGDSGLVSSLAAPMEFLDQEKVSWGEIERLGRFATAVAAVLPGRDAGDAWSIGELTAAWRASGLDIAEAVTLVEEHGEELAKLAFEGLPIEYATAMVKTEDTRAW